MSSVVPGTARPFIEVNSPSLDVDETYTFVLPFYARSVTISASKDAEGGNEHKYDINENSELMFTLDVSPSARSNKVSYELGYHCEPRFLVKKVHVKSGADGTLFTLKANV